MIQRLLFCTALLLALCNCKTRPQTTDSSSSGTNNLVTIGLRKEVKIPNSNVNLQFNAVMEDNRCPAGVTCVWEGLAIADIDAFSGNQKSNFQVGTRDFVPQNVKKSFVFAGYKFTLTALKPHPGGKQEATTVTFKYEKEN
ncbi:hypothetical protein [Chryseobacterium sp. SC28]|uniref:hypothetical protein n=1 Tax=Chryseobacterium sp. SC28 TaxID=2268028 RepID=UPI000F6454CE|nr:hypothetical protein [Chryseobacterium sp. SC28]RRQ45923.1 hypothetical protein DTW91_07515 [Chryseobacterium sp. SC28]